MAGRSTISAPWWPTGWSRWSGQPLLIMERAPVARPLQTGIKVVDALVPIGRGQRELIIGDRQTGKTAIALDTILNQAGTGVISVYCAIGQRGDAVARVISRLRESGVMESCVVMAGGRRGTAGFAIHRPLFCDHDRRAVHAGRARRADCL